MAIVKSKLLKQLSNNYPNFLKKDLEKFIKIECNLEFLEFFQQIFKKQEYQEIQKQVKKLILQKKKTIHFKMSKELFKKLNNEKE